MADKVTWGILGCANIVRRRFMPGIGASRHAEVVAIASREKAKAEAFASELGIPRFYGSYDALLDDPAIEAVYIPLPNWLHAEWIIRASEKGKHVLCEKPLAIDEKDVRKLMEVCGSNGTLLMEGFMFRFHPRTLKAKQLLDSGKIGDPRVFRAWSGHPLKDLANIRYGEHGGALMDVGCYCVNAAHYFFGEMPVAVFGRWHKQRSDGVDTTFAGMLEFPQGRIALFDCSFEYSYRQGYDMVGTEGTLTAQRGFVPGDSSARSLKLTSETGTPERVRVRGADQFALEIDHFSECVRSGRQPMLTLEETALNFRVMDALRLSAETGERVEISNS